MDGIGDSDQKNSTSKVVVSHSRSSPDLTVARERGRRHRNYSPKPPQTREEKVGRHRHRRHKHGDGDEQHDEEESKLPREDLVVDAVSRSKQHGLVKTKPTAEAVEDNAGNFAEDRKGDPLNLVYGSLHHYSVPRYRTAGYGHLIGMSRRFTVKSDGERSGRVVQGEMRDSSTKTRGKGLASANQNRKTSPTPMAPRASHDESLEQQDDYIPFNSRMRRKRRRIEGLNLPLSSDAQVPELDQPDSDAAQSSSSYTTSDSKDPISEDVKTTFEEFREKTQQRQLVELSRRVDNHPDDVQAWFALADHQEVILRQDGSGKALSNAEKLGLADVKISIYEKALSKVKGAPDRNRLIIGLMQEGSKVWDTKKLANHWRSILKENVGSLPLWMTYLDFLQSNVLTFTYEQCKSMYAECFRMASLQRDSVESEQMRIYVLLRMTMFMQEAGFAEYAIGIWQALLEFNFSRPPNLAEDELSSFRAFWDSEVARIGEKGSRGWSSSAAVVVEPRSDTTNLKVDSRRIFETWADCESEKDSNTKLPARSLDDVEEDDPYRVIIFSDVRGYLFLPAAPENQKLLLDAFLRFCNLPSPVSYSHYNQRRWTTDPFLRIAKLEPKRDPLSSDDLRGTYRDFPTPNFATETVTLLPSTESWFNAWQGSSTTEGKHIDLEWSRLSLRRLVDAFPENDSLAEYSVSLEFQIDPKEARKYAKALLKTHSSGLHLYNVFGLIESRLGNLDAAERVWATALSMSETFSKEAQDDAVVLWKTWIWESLDQKSPMKALTLLLAIPDGHINIQKLSETSTRPLEPNPTAVLKCERLLQNHLFRAQSLEHGPGIVHLTELSALLSYLSNQFSLSAALQIYSKTTQSMSRSQKNPSTTIIEELIHQSRARLLHFHAQSSGNGYRPREISIVLAGSLRKFPSNTIFLTLYHHYTQHILLTDRIRSILPILNMAQDDAATSNPSIIPHMFSIWTELRRPSYGGSTMHSIRAAFERAVSHDAAGKSSPSLWKAFIECELQNDETANRTTMNSSSQSSSSRKSPPMSSAPKQPPIAAVDVYYRAIRACPWAKHLYMLAFLRHRLRDSLGFNALRTIYETMAEKELRIHVDIGEFLEEREQLGQA